MAISAHKILFSISLIFCITVFTAFPIEDTTNAGNLVNKSDSTLHSFGGVVQYDSSEVELRTAENRINEYKRSKDFNYLTERPEGKSIKDIILLWIWEYLLAPIIGGGLSVANIIILALLLALLVFLALKLVGGGTSGLFYSAEKKGSNVNLNKHNINKIDFDANIANAETNLDLKEATEYLYLKSLALLHQKKYIKWRRDKTNHEYFSEINNMELRDQYSWLTYYFEHVVYGDVPVDYDRYKKIKSFFTKFYGKFNDE